MTQDKGALIVEDVAVRRRLSFLDYMAGGCEIQCMIAIDFSGGNPPTNEPSSCHYAGSIPCLAISCFSRDLFSETPVATVSTPPEASPLCAAVKFASVG